MIARLVKKTTISKEQIAYQQKRYYNKTMIKNDEYFMKEAFKEAKKAYKKGEVPIGCVLVNNENKEILARAHNLREEKHDISAHAEIIALKKAGQKSLNRRSENTTLYVTVEPCVMCAGAILQSRISRIVFGIFEPATGGFGGKIVLTKEFKSNLTITSGILKDKIQELMKEFFEERRQ